MIVIIKRFYLSIQLGLLFLLSGCAQKQSIHDADIDALLWSTASAEYNVIVRQIFSQARRQLGSLLQKRGLSAALEQSSPESTLNSLPPAVIVDVDDTLLSNGAFHYQLIAEQKPFTADLWAHWVNQARSTPISGSLEYINFAVEQGITVFYVSNRDITYMEPTWRNLVQLGYPLNEKKRQLLMLNGEDGWGWDKGTRRAYIAKKYRILQIIGDGLGDFMSDTGAMSLAEQRQASARYMSYWGERWFMLPNPVYGDWEKAILNSEGETPSPALDPIRAKYRFIRGGESQGVW